MTFQRISLLVAGMCAVVTFCEAQEESCEREGCPQEACGEEICAREPSPEQCCRREHSIFLSPHYYDKPYEPLPPRPDWPSANNNFIEEMTR